ncbi:MAG: hypothetical protein JNK30_15095 [Phenylobacterium sp.]|uniref:hypothetical protein n=1 Tax=Phenylobacterium sp. TaxID=1871053 RepID=UPI001A3CC15F|nr:hypothetical protein [Phenylobacterium sp.]MBL8772708.1 hypothetical protein [Phenylobacterium sp.]
MRAMLCAAVFSAMIAGPALAQPAPAQAGEPGAKPSRTVYVCDKSAATRRGFEREFGVAAQFVKADQAAATGGSWAAPKCITAAEARKLKRELASAK